MLFASFVLPEVDTETIPKYSRFPYRLAGWLLGALTLALALLSIASCDLDSSQSSDETGPLFVTFFILIAAAYSCFQISDQQRSLRNRWRLFTSSKPPVLYLRSFVVEGWDARSGMLWASPGSNFDHLLSDAVEPFGVLTALGHPDGLPAHNGRAEGLPGERPLARLHRAACRGLCCCAGRRGWDGGIALGASAPEEDDRAEEVLCPDRFELSASSGREPKARTLGGFRDPSDSG